MHAEGVLVATTRRLPTDARPDLLAAAGDAGVVLVRDGVGIAGRGEALRCRIDGAARPRTAELVHAMLGSIVPEGDDIGAPGRGAVAFGALGFRNDDATALQIPSALVGVAPDGRSWVTTIAPRHGAAADVADALAHEMTADAARPRDTSPPPPVEVDAIIDEITPATWAAMVGEVTRSIAADTVRKVVLARSVDVVTRAPLTAGDLLGRLAAANPSCLLYSVDGFVGASPELLVEREHDVVRAQPMAGTAPQTGDPVHDEGLVRRLLASTKDREEHRITIDHVHDRLLEWCAYLDEEPVPSVVRLRRVAHLATWVEGRLHEPLPSVLDLVDALHPTPAVCGDPTSAALAMIATLEPRRRGRYGGPVGWVDAEGNGAWAVGIRCAQLDERTARLTAGVGLVVGSDAAAEHAETEAKLGALRDALGLTTPT